MRYLRKSKHSKIIKEGWKYSLTNARQNRKIRNELLNEQVEFDSYFCAYTERRVLYEKSCDVEHFDERKKGEDDDDYWNWYAVLHDINRGKPSIRNFEPIADPYDENLPERIHYVDGEFYAVDQNDQEAKNLIDFLGWNSLELVKDRNSLGSVDICRG